MAGGCERGLRIRLDGTFGRGEGDLACVEVGATGPTVEPNGGSGGGVAGEIDHRGTGGGEANATAGEGVEAVAGENRAGPRVTPDRRGDGEIVAVGVTQGDIGVDGVGVLIVRAGRGDGVGLLGCTVTDGCLGGVMDNTEDTSVGDGDGVVGRRGGDGAAEEDGGKIAKVAALAAAGAGWAPRGLGSRGGAGGTTTVVVVWWCAWLTARWLWTSTLRTLVVGVDGVGVGAGGLGGVMSTSMATGGWGSVAPPVKTGWGRGHA